MENQKKDYFCFCDKYGQYSSEEADFSIVAMIKVNTYKRENKYANI